MDIQSIDNYVWENYHLTTTDASFRRWFYENQTISGRIWMHRLLEHAKLKEEEHRLNYRKLSIFKDSLPVTLRDCVDPFLDQQARIHNTYKTIYIYFYNRA